MRAHVLAAGGSVVQELVLFDDGLHHDEDQSDGVYARDRWVLSELTRRGVPCALVLGGGYLRSGAEATAWLHAHAHRAARDLGL